LAGDKAENIIDRKHSNSSRRYTSWAVILFAALVVFIGGLSLFVISDKNIRYLQNFTASLELIGLLYPESFSAEMLIETAREAVFEELDRYSGYLEPEELRRVTEEFTGSYGGIGITVVPHGKGLMVMSVRESGPAGQAGMRTGDVIIQADSITLEKMSTYKATFLLRGEEGTSVTVTVARNHLKDTLEYALRRERFKLIHIPFAGVTENGNLYIRILDFEAGLTADLMDVLDSLYLKDRDSVTGVIVDLRGNPGGLLSEAVAASDLFLDKGYVIAGVRGRSRWQTREYCSSGRDVLNGLPLAVLISRGSASAAEITAGALKYARRAILIGDTTFGKGLIQEFRSLFDGSGVRLTTARYYFEGGVFINDPSLPELDDAVGIPPDYFIELIEDEPFPVGLESSLSMRDFAFENQDKILTYSPFTEASPVWLDSFFSYATRNDFRYESGLTELAKFVRDEIVYRDYSDETFAAIDRICRLSEEDDRSQFDKYKDYIKKRIYQIALETRDGFAESYREVVLPYRRDIVLAEKLLQSEVTN
jgi:carboxyl-terminal processing protease